MLATSGASLKPSAPVAEYIPGIAVIINGQIFSYPVTLNSKKVAANKFLVQRTNTNKNRIFWIVLTKQIVIYLSIQN